MTSPRVTRLILATVLVATLSFAVVLLWKSQAISSTITSSTVPDSSTSTSSTSTTTTTVATTTSTTTTTTSVPKVLISYSVAARGTVDIDVEEFASRVAKTFADSRGWSLGGDIGFRRVSTGGDFTLWISEAALLPVFNSECSVQYSCTVGRNVIINLDRWKHGSPSLGLPVDEYRDMVVNHETGHWLGFGHLSCPGSGQPANVMQQQSKGGSFLGACVPNAWPTEVERNLLATRRGLVSRN